MNDSINVFRRDYLINSDSNQSANTKAYIMPKERSVDIDYPLDLKFAEFLMQEDKNDER
jgi:CMP-N-acetylneuraminic acid synthetase